MFFNTTGYTNIGPKDLNKKLRTGEDIFLLDVRTPAEHAQQSIEGSHLIPVQELAYRIQEIPKDKEIVVYCRVGNRSAFASAHLSKLGYNVKNLEGGILVWNMAGNVSMATA